MVTNQKHSGEGRLLTIEAKPGPLGVDLARAAIVVVDMQNDFGAKGGMFDRAGIDISMIQRAVQPTAKVLAAGRAAGVKVVYLKMGFKPDLSDLGSEDSPNRVRHLMLGVGKSVTAPNGKESRVLVRDTWNTDILPELTPRLVIRSCTNTASADSTRRSWTLFSRKWGSSTS